ncbi:MAG: hypothetical protein GX488_02805 [Clostridiales bacterium]|nr:hypothetical protein [Clostridiales bacterium]
MKDGFIKVAAGTPEIRVADCEYNKNSVLSLVKSAESEGAKVLVMPELCLTGYTCGDLFMQTALIREAETALSQILISTTETDMIFAVGLPVFQNGKLYNCAAVCCKGQLLGLVPKLNLPNYGEFYEKRWFVEGEKEPKIIFYAGRETYFGSCLLFKCRSLPNLCIGVEICEDLWAVMPPSSDLAQAGANVILNLSASDEIASKDSYRRSLVTGQSGRLVCGYIYADAGDGESTTDMVFAGHDIISENGAILSERRFGTCLCIS